MGVKAAETKTPLSDSRHVITVNVRSNDSHVIKVVTENYRKGGELRGAIQNDGAS